ncbi:MAG: hypothetical protein HGA75_15910 [Thiobacillus sp.]|nr:hypothetical protein [Thiobacillus sp.]
MIDSGFAVATALPFAWQAGQPSASTSHGSLLLLRVVNMLDAGEIESDRSHERVEARLDLMLYWLGQQLFGDQAAPATVPLRLEAGSIAWPADSLPASEEVILSLHIHPAMAAPLRLAGHVTGMAGGHVMAKLQFDSEELSDAWTQWLFRRHRRAVHEARQREG